ncbi:hypothetical protein HFD88_009184 [Aspergillus terreus]|nr:hypothetical protein HFD88_009184 [Aspergillus terreus]
MSQLSEDQKKIVRDELRQHLATLHNIRSKTIGGPSGIVIPPYRAMKSTVNDRWPSNVIVDPDTLRIRAILDWEYAGFFPEYFEAPFYERLGPSIPLDGEKDDDQPSGASTQTKRQLNMRRLGKPARSPKAPQKKKTSSDNNILILLTLLSPYLQHASNPSTMIFNTFRDFHLDIVGFLAILGEASVAVNYQVSTLSYFIFLPRLLPAPQAFIRPARPLRLESVPGVVIGVSSGNLCRHVYRIPHIILPGEKLNASKGDYTVRRVEVRIKPGRKNGPLVTARTFGLLSLLSVVGCAISFALLGLSIHYNDGWALVATVLLSVLSTVIGVACKWELKLGKRIAKRDIPSSDVIVCYPNGSFLIVKCDEDVARALFFAPERCDYLLGSLAYRSLSLLGTLMLMFGVVALGNSQLELQLAFGASYLLLNVAYWVVAAMPERLHWDYSALEITEEIIVSPSAKRSFTDALWQAIKQTKATRWVRTGQVAPDTRAWDEWLKRAHEVANRETEAEGVLPDDWDAGKNLSECIKMYAMNTESRLREEISGEGK